MPYETIYYYFKYLNTFLNHFLFVMLLIFGKKIMKKSILIKLNIPLSAPVERLFSFAGWILSPQRSNLGDDRFEKLIFLNANKKFEIKYILIYFTEKCSYLKINYII